VLPKTSSTAVAPFASRSLERSLQAGLLLSFVVLVFVFWWGGSLTSRLLAESVVHTRLAQEGHALIAEREAFLGVPVVGERLRWNAAYDAPLSGRYFRLDSPNQRPVLSRSSWDVSLPDTTLAPGVQLRTASRGPSDEPLLLWRGGFQVDGVPITVTVAEDITRIEERWRAFRVFFAILSLILLVAMLLVQTLIVRHLLAPVDALRDDLRRIERGEIKSVSEKVPSEITPLVQEFNRLLVRFEQRLRQSRNAAGNLAHALKGPLNLLMRSTDGSQHAERIAQLIDGELTRARLAGRGSATQRLNLADELPALSRLLQQVYADKSVDVRYNIPGDVEWPHDRQDMLELIGNLLDNAVKWANEVVILTVRHVDGIRLEVEDDGPGVSAAQLRQLTARGVRLDESVAGHGLGLSIVKDIVDTYQGTLEFSESQRLGGLQVTVLLNEPGPA